MRHPANDAHLIQLVKSRIGREIPGGTSINVSSCQMVVTLHGLVEDAETAREIVASVGSVPGVQGVEDRLRCNERHSRA